MASRFGTKPQNCRLRTTTSSPSEFKIRFRENGNHTGFKIEDPNLKMRKMHDKGEHWRFIGDRKSWPCRPSKSLLMFNTGWQETTTAESQDCEDPMSCLARADLPFDRMLPSGARKKWRFFEASMSMLDIPIQVLRMNSRWRMRVAIR